MSKRKIILAFTGKAGSGKSTCLKILSENVSRSHVFTIKFADTLYEIQNKIYQTLEMTGIYTRPSNFVKDRRLLQFLGTEWGRNTISTTLWVDIWKSKVHECCNSSLLKINHIIVTDDVRFDEEAEAIKQLDGYVVRITSSTNVPEGGIGDKNHASELGIDSKYVDFEIVNDSTKEELAKKVMEIYNKISLGK